MHFPSIGSFWLAPKAQLLFYCLALSYSIPFLCLSFLLCENEGTFHLQHFNIV